MRKFASIFFVAVMFCALGVNALAAEYRSVAVDGKVVEVSPAASQVEKRAIIFPDDFPPEIDKVKVVQALVYEGQERYVIPGRYEISDFFLLTMAVEVKGGESLVIKYDRGKGEISTSVEPANWERIKKIKKMFPIAFLGIIISFLISAAGGALVDVNKKKLGWTLIAFAVAGVFAVVGAVTDADASALVLAGGSALASALAGALVAADVLVAAGALVAAVLTAVAVVAAPMFANIIFIKILAFYLIAFLSGMMIIRFLAKKVKAESE